MSRDEIERIFAGLARGAGGHVSLWRVDAATLAAVLEDPRASAIESLAIVGDIGSHGAELVAASPHLRRVVELDLSGCGIGDAGLAALAASPVLASVQRLLLGPRLPNWEKPHDLHRSRVYVGNAIGDAGFRALAASAFTGSLVAIDLSENAAGDAGVGALAGADLPRLSSLCLRGTRGTSAIAAIVAAAGFAVRLSELDLAFSGLGDEGARAVASAVQLGSLRKLGLEGNAIASPGGGALASSHTLAALEELDLRTNVLGEEDVRRFAAREGLPSLRRLGLDRNGLTTGRLAPAYDQGVDLGESPEPMSPHEIQRRFFTHRPLEIF